MLVHNIAMGPKMVPPECQHHVNFINMVNGHFSMKSFIMKLLHSLDLGGAMICYYIY